MNMFEGSFDPKSMDVVLRELGLYSTVKKWESPLAMAQALDPKVRRSPALDLIDKELVKVSQTPGSRLMICMSPQEGKSQLASRAFPRWLLQQDNNLRIAIVSFSDEKAREWGADIKLDAETYDGTEGTVDIGIKLRPDSQAAGRWKIVGGIGGVFCCGVSGGLSGRPVDCFQGETRILTEEGYTSIYDLYRSPHPPRVASFNHTTQRPEWKRIIAARAIPNRDLVEIITRSGRKVVCTPEHRIYTSEGYKQASSLRTGDRLTIGRGKPQETLHNLRSGKENEESNLPVLLRQGKSTKICRSNLHALRKEIPVQSGGIRKENKKRTEELLLHSEVYVSGIQISGKTLQTLWETHRIQGSKPTLLLTVVPRNCEASKGIGKEKELSSVQTGFHSPEQSDSVLRKDLCGPSTFSENDWNGEFPLQNWDKLLSVVQEDETSHCREGFVLPSVRTDRYPVYSSYQRGTPGQQARESYTPLQDVSCSTPQIEDDTVSVVRHLCGKRDTVYDIQVEGNCNFFAEEILSHNCLIIDDPIKNAEDSRSKNIRDRCWRFWQSVAIPRLGPDSSVLIIQTRWHEDDLAGRVLESEGSRWKLISIPAICESKDDPLGREIGEPMISVRGNRDWNDIKSRVGEHTWAALYQQRPAPLSGGLFKRENFRYWSYLPTTMPLYGPMGGLALDLENRPVMVDDCWRFMTIDLAASTKTSADWTVAAVWGVSMSGDLILLDQARDKIPESDHWKLVRPLVSKWRVDCVFVESRMFGTTFVVDATKAGIPIQELKADTDKFTRALPAATRIDSHRIWFPAQAPWLHDWEDELAYFPNGTHDDIVDVLSYAARVLTSKWIPHEINIQRPKVPFSDEVADYALRSAIGPPSGVESLLFRKDTTDPLAQEWW